MTCDLFELRFNSGRIQPLSPDYRLTLDDFGALCAGEASLVAIDTCSRGAEWPLIGTFAAPQRGRSLLWRKRASHRGRRL